MPSRPFFVALALILTGFWFLFRAKPPRPAPGVLPPAPQASSPRQGHPVPPEGPSPEVVSALMFSQYEQIEKAGGMPVTLTATGKSTVLHPKLYQARTDSCRRVPQSLPMDYECHLMIQLSLAADGSDPSWKGERLFVTWDSVKGEWK